MINLPRILAGLLLSTLIGAVAYRRQSLTRSGWLGAVITGTLTFGFGGWTFGLTLIAFFISSSLLSHFKQSYKQQLAGEKFEKGGQRDLGQTLANGGIAGVIALGYGLLGQPLALLALFAGTLATVTADTWATELGVLSRKPPRSVLTLRPVAPGTSGGITLAGTLAGALGAVGIGICMWLLAGIEFGVWNGRLVPSALLGGVAGSLADSVLGATVQAMYRDHNGEETERQTAPDDQPNTLVRGWRWMHNDVVNLLSSLLGAVVALFLLLL